MPASFRKAHPQLYRKLQAALIEARDSPEFRDYLEANKLGDLSVGKPGEAFEAAFAADMENVEKFK